MPEVRREGLFLRRVQRALIVKYDMPTKQSVEKQAPEYTLFRGDLSDCVSNSLFL
jgi:hypothetical protein